MSFNELCEKLSAKNSFQWSVIMVDKGEFWSSTRMNFGRFIAFGIYKRPVKGFTV